MPDRVGIKTLPLEMALAAPALLWLLAGALVLIAALAGFPALAAPADLTISEAAAMRDEAEVLRQIRAGVDPNARARLGPGIIRDEEYLVTPLEAATAAGHPEVVRLLVRHGVSLTEANATLLLCLAQEHNAAEIVSFLQEHLPAHLVSDCKGVRLPL